MGVKALIVVEESRKPSLALTDVLGASLTERTAKAMLEGGADEVWVVSQQGEPEHTAWKSPQVRYKKVTGGKLWEEAESLFQNLGHAETVLLARMNVYGEVDWRRMAQRHRASGGRILRVWATETEPADIYAVDPRAEKECAFLFHARLGHARLEAARYVLSEDEYAHPLRDAADLREIGRDALNLQTQMRPVGSEVRPGIWVAKEGRIDPGVRLVAPVYVGRYARVRTGAVITRGSTVEHHARVDCGTVVEDASVLPFTVLGAGLDLCHSVVAGARIHDLRRKLDVEIADPTLVHEVPHNAGVRLLAKAASLASYVPLQFWRGITQRPLPEGTPEAACEADFAGVVIQEKAPPSLRPKLVMERYGNQ